MRSSLLIPHRFHIFVQGITIVSCSIEVISVQLSVDVVKIVPCLPTAFVNSTQIRCNYEAEARREITRHTPRRNIPTLLFCSAIFIGPESGNQKPGKETKSKTNHSITSNRCVVVALLCYGVVASLQSRLIVVSTTKCQMWMIVVMLLWRYVRLSKDWNDTPSHSNHHELEDFGCYIPFLFWNLLYNCDLS